MAMPSAYYFVRIQNYNLHYNSEGKTNANRKTGKLNFFTCKFFREALEKFHRRDVCRGLEIVVAVNFQTLFKCEL